MAEIVSNRPAVEMPKLALPQGDFFVRPKEETFHPWTIGWLMSGSGELVKFLNQVTDLGDLVVGKTEEEKTEAMMIPESLRNLDWLDLMMVVGGRQVRVTVYGGPNTDFDDLTTPRVKGDVVISYGQLTDGGEDETDKWYFFQLEKGMAWNRQQSLQRWERDKNQKHVLYNPAKQSLNGEQREELLEIIAALADPTESVLRVSWRRMNEKPIEFNIGGGGGKAVRAVQMVRVPGGMVPVPVPVPVYIPTPERL